MAVEVRYVGTRGQEQWRTFNGGNEIGSLNYNEFNIFENGFLNEFKQAQSNLQANIAAGRGNTFAFTGAPGTVPLPTFLAFFNGQNARSVNSAVHRHQLDQPDLPELPGRSEPEPVRIRVGQCEPV